SFLRRTDASISEQAWNLCIEITNALRKKKFQSCRACRVDEKHQVPTSKRQRTAKFQTPTILVRNASLKIDPSRFSSCWMLAFGVLASQSRKFLKFVATPKSQPRTN